MMKMTWQYHKQLTAYMYDCSLIKCMRMQQQIHVSPAQSVYQARSVMYVRERD